MPGTVHRSVAVAAVFLAVVMPAAGASAAAPRMTPAAPPRCSGASPPASTSPDVSVAQRLFDSERVRALSSGRSITVALLASGVDADHRQLDGAAIGAGADFLTSRGRGTGRYDCDGLGTAVASLIVGGEVTGVRSPGLARDTTILPVVVGTDGGNSATGGEGATDGEGGDGSVTPERLADAVMWAVDHRADVISVPVTVHEDHPALKRAVAGATAAGIVVVASVDNGGANSGKPYPAAYPGVVGVHAVDGSLRPLGTYRGKEIDLVAPGKDVVAASPGGGYGTYTGSGVATGFVTAVAALVASRHDIGGDEVTRRLRATASPAIGSRDMVGSGLVDPYRALTESLATGEPRRPDGPAGVGPDPAAVARAAELRNAQRIALVVTAAALALAATLTAVRTVWSGGRRRRWRPTRTRAMTLPPRSSDVSSTPVQLFTDLRLR